LLRDLQFPPQSKKKICFNLTFEPNHAKIRCEIKLLPKLHYSSLGKVILFIFLSCLYNISSFRSDKCTQCSNNYLCFISVAVGSWVQDTNHSTSVEVSLYWIINWFLKHKPTKVKGNIFADALASIFRHHWTVLVRSGSY